MIFYILVNLYISAPDGSDYVLRLSNREYSIGTTDYVPLLIDADELTIREKGYTDIDGLLELGGVVAGEPVTLEADNQPCAPGPGPLDIYTTEGYVFKDKAAEILWAEVPAGQVPDLADFQSLFTGVLQRPPTAGDVFSLSVLPSISLLSKPFRAPRFEGAGGAVQTATSAADERVEVEQSLLPVLDDWTFQFRIEMPEPANTGRLWRLGSTSGGPMRLQVVDLASGEWRLNLVVRGKSGTQYQLPSDLVGPGVHWLTFSGSSTETAVWRGKERVFTGPPVGEALPDLDDALVLGSNSLSRPVTFGAFRWWSVALTDDEVEVTQAAPLDAIRWDGALELDFEFEARFGDTVHDRSGNERHGKILGATNPNDTWGSTETGEREQHDTPMPVCLGHCSAVAPVPIDRRFGLWLASVNARLIRHLTYGGVPFGEQAAIAGTFRFKTDSRTIFDLSAGGSNLEWPVPGQTLIFTGSSDSSNDGNFTVESLSPAYSDYEPWATVNVTATDPVPWSPSGGDVAGVVSAVTGSWSNDEGTLSLPAVDGQPVFMEVHGGNNVPGGNDARAGNVALAVINEYSEPALAGRLLQFGTVAVTPEQVGVVVAPPDSSREVLHQVLRSARAWMHERDDGSFFLTKIQNAPLTEIPAEQIEEVVPLDNGLGLDGVRVGYARTWAPQDESTLRAGADPEIRSRLTSPYQWVTWPAAAQGDVREVLSVLKDRVDAEALAKQLYTLSQCVKYRLVLKDTSTRDQLTSFHIGRIVRPTWSRYLVDSPEALVIALRRRPFDSKGRMELTILVLPEDA